MRLFAYLAALFLIVSLAAGCNSESEPKAAAVVSTAESTPAATSSPIPPTPAPTPLPSPSWAEFGAAITGDLSTFSTQFSSMSRLIENPNPTDARWRTETRDAANEIKKTLATIRSRTAPACAQSMVTELGKMTAAFDRTADEVIAGVDGQTTNRFAAARRSADEGLVYLGNSSKMTLSLSC